MAGYDPWLHFSHHRPGGYSRNFWLKALILDKDTMTLKKKVDEFEVP